MSDTRSRTLTVANTFLVGAPKSGTTYLAEWLGRSPEVFAPPVKEPGFFMEARQYDRGLAHYASAYYGAARGQPVVLDATPWYLYPASVPLRIADVLGPGAARIVIVLREPLARAVSMYYDQLGRRREHRSMFDAFADDLDVIDPEAELAREAGPDLFQHYLLCGRYAGPVRRYLDAFGPESVRVFLAEELWGDPGRVRAELEAFLGVTLPEPPERAANPASRAHIGLIESVLSRVEASASPLRGALSRVPGAAGRVRVALDALARWNQTPVEYPKVEPELREVLEAWYAPANRRLERVLERSLEAWR